MPRPSYNIAVIGGGVVGCAVARELGKRFEDVVLIEKEPSAGFHTSGRNSGVIHSGINPKPGTLKARLCVEGNRELRQYCRDYKIPMEEGGTLVLALRDEEIPVLEELKSRAGQNGVPGVRLLSPAEIRDHEPHARGIRGLHSPAGAIVDSLALTRSLAENARKEGVEIRLGQEAQEFQETPKGVSFHCGSEVLTAGLLINCAGLHADRLAHQMGVGKNYTVAPFRGEYFVVNRPGEPLVKSMIYPAPNLKFPFLGVHLTKTTTGKILIGPNAVPAFGREAYRASDIRPRDLFEMAGHKGFWNAFFHNRDLMSVAWNELKNSCSQEHFWRQASQLVDGLLPEHISLEAKTGIRPQLIRSDGELVEDLVIETTAHSIHILNVISPGMTSSLAFARWFTAQINPALVWTREPAEGAA